MRGDRISRWFVMAVAAAGLAGCAAPEAAPEGTSMLLEVAHVLTRQEILTGQVRMPSADGRRDTVAIPMYLGLLASGVQSGDMVDGSVVVGRTQYYWSEPDAASVRETGGILLVPRGLRVEAGNVVEAERGPRFATVVRVKYRTLAEGGCFYGTDDGTVAGMDRTALRPAGRDRAVSLRCADLAAQGWSPVQRCNGIEWTRRSPADRKTAFYGESRALERLGVALIAPFVPCYVLPQ